MDPLALAVGAAAAAGICAALQSRRQARQAEAEANRLRQELQAERHAASHDPLTGLPNRRAFYQLGSELVADPARMPLIGVVIDIDGFKKINDTFGHAAGDEVLVTLAGRLIGCVPGNLVARLGGDEFVALLGSAGGDLQWPYLLAERLATSLAEPMLVGGRPLTVTASIGLATVPSPALLADVLHRADRAMYREKSSRRREIRLSGLRDADGYEPAVPPAAMDAAQAHWAEPPSIAPEPSRLLTDTLRPILAAG